MRWSRLRFDENNVVVDQVLTEEEIRQIYISLNYSYNNYVMERYGQKISNFNMPKSALDKIVKLCEEISGVSGLILEAYQFSRYEKFERPDGTISNPKLIPHYDRFPEPRFTFDYQIKSNTSWPLVVEESEIALLDNQALTFSGTHQVHWRTPKEFEPGEFIDMIFCHLFLPGDIPNTEDHWEIMDAKEYKYVEMTGIRD